MKAIGTPLVLLVLLFSAIGCAPVSDSSAWGAANSPTSPTGAVTASAPKTTAGVAQAAADLPDYSNGTTIALGEKIVVNGPGASVRGNAVHIIAGGAYRISGKLNNGQIIVNAQDKEPVNLILDGVDITCATSAPIYVMNAKKVILILAEGSENRVSDGASYVIEDAQTNEPNAAIFSKSDLVINGKGSLTVNANYRHAIVSKDDLEIRGGNITVCSVGDGIRGRDSIVVANATIRINAAADGMQSNNDEDSKKGFVAIESGTMDITAGEDGIQAETNLTVRGGNLMISSGGGSPNAPSAPSGAWGRNPPASTGNTASAKALKAGVHVAIEGGTIKIDAADDALHSNNSLKIANGELTLASGDDAIHADVGVEISGGQINITKSYEGVESAVITISGSILHVVSSDDGINVVSENATPAMPGRPMPNRFAVSDKNYVDISGGYIAVDALGDGLDINGSIKMSGGVLLVNGPIRNDNGALDYDGTFKMTGGLLVAAGSAGMAQGPDMSSTQCAVMLYFPSPLPAGTLLHIATDKGQEILTFAPLRQYQALVFASPALVKGATYIVYTGGSSTGTLKDSLYSGGKYTGGTQFASFTVSNVITTVGSFGGMRGGGFRGGVRP